MVVCKFFQQGYCRYGQNCRFEHVYGSKFSYHANQPSQDTPVKTIVTDEQLVKQVQSDIQSALKGGQWLLSCYAPFKENPNFPGISDLSPEEARLFVYEAKANNNLEQAVSYLNNLYQETRQKYEQLLQSHPSIVRVLKSLYKGEVVASPFANAFGGTTNNNATSIFRSAVQNPSVFAQNYNGSVFNQQQNSFASNPDSGKSIFAQANQSAFVQSSPNQPNNIFGVPASDGVAKSIFAQASQDIFGVNASNNSSQNIFANQNLFASPDQNQLGQTSPFSNTQSKEHFANQTGGNIFQSAQSPTTNVFHKPDNASSVFGVSNVFQQNSDPSVYSKLEDLTQEDVEAFKSDSFKLGFIPEIAPPKELCT